MSDGTSSDSEASFLEPLKPTLPVVTPRDYSNDVFISLADLTMVLPPSVRCRVIDDISEAPPQGLTLEDDDDDDDDNSKGKGPIIKATRIHDDAKQASKKKKKKRKKHEASSGAAETSQDEASRRRKHKQRNQRSGSSIAVGKELQKHISKERSLPPPPETPIHGRKML